MVLLALAPEGSVPKIYSGCRAFKICLPPGTPVGSGGIQLETDPKGIVEILTRQFKRDEHDVVVSILDRPWNKGAIDEFRAAGATVHAIPSGDFEEHLRAGCPVESSGPIHLSYGTGGLPEGFLAVPFLRWSGAPMLLKPVPEPETSIPEVEQRVYDVSSMIDSDDCILAVAGISHVDGPKLVPGICYDAATQTLRVTVFIVSPLFDRCRVFTVSFSRNSQPKINEIEEADQYLIDLSNSPGHRTLGKFGPNPEEKLIQFLSCGGMIETGLRETRAGFAESASWPLPEVQGSPLSESKLLELLCKLETNGIVTRSENVHPFDSSEYKVTWKMIA